MTADASPRFGQADLTNCERELIHLAGSIQPHGLLLTLQPDELEIVQASESCARFIGLAPDALSGRSLDVLGGDLAAAVQALRGEVLEEPARLRARTVRPEAEWDGALHRAGDVLVLELEPADAAFDAALLRADDDGRPWLEGRIAAAIERFSSAANVGALADAVVRSVREIAGYDRVMVYKFDPEGHGKVIAEAREARLEPLLGHRYPASDIPQRARQLYLRNRIRVLVDVHYVPSPLLPRLLPDGAELDMSQCGLRSMSPLHLQYLKNMGVTATLVASLVREGRLWGLIACHHYAPRAVHPALRSAVALLGEIASTRIAALENYAYAQVVILVRRMEQRLIEATSTEGDWRHALMRSPRTLLQPLEATGAALFDEGEILTAGEVPSTPELRALRDCVHERQQDMLFATHSIEREQPLLRTLTPVASGVLAVKLSAARPDYLMWFRKEQLETVTWAGDPTKPLVIGNDPRELSPRRSFAAWSELVRGTATSWTGVELALARAIGAALADIILQVQAVRLLIAEHQLKSIRDAMRSSQEPVVVAGSGGRVLLVNEAFSALAAVPTARLATLQDVARCFSPVESLQERLHQAGAFGQPWRGELAILQPDGSTVPATVRLEVVPGRDGQTLGIVLIANDLREARRAQQARRHLEDTLQAATADAPASERPVDVVMDAIITNASLAAMDIADADGAPPVAPLLQEVEASALRATALYAQVRAYTERKG